MSGTKKSNFVTQSTMESSDTIDFVSGGQNFKLPLSDLKTVLGVLGTLSTLGDVTGIPALKVTDLVYGIRNILGGPGILAELSSEDGIKLKSNFTVDSTGAAILINPTADAPTLRSLVSGAGVLVASDGDTITFDNRFSSDATGSEIVDDLTADEPVLASIVAGTSMSVTKTGDVITITYAPSGASSSTVVVYAESDFPTAIGGVITLLDDTEYFVAQDISTANRFVLGSNTVVSGADRIITNLTYTGVGNMFSSVDNSNKVRDLTILFPSGSLLDVSGTGVETFKLLSCIATGATLGTIEGMYEFASDTSDLNVSTDGFTFIGNNSRIFVDKNNGIITAGTLVDLGVSTTSDFTFTNSLGTLSAGATFLEGAADSANINTGGNAVVSNVVAIGSGTALVGVTPDDALWEFVNNSSIPDSHNAVVSHNAGTTITIATQNVPVLLGATWTSTELSRFTATAAGRFTYIGKGAHVNIDASIIAEMTGGTDDCTFYIYKNGSALADSSLLIEIKDGAPRVVPMLWGLDMETDDYFEIFAENNDGTTNITIVHAILRMS